MPTLIFYNKIRNNGQIDININREKRKEESKNTLSIFKIQNDK